MSKELKIYTLAELQDLLKVTKRTMYEYISSGELEAFKAGREWRITGDSLEAFIKAKSNRRAKVLKEEQ